MSRLAFASRVPARRRVFAPLAIREKGAELFELLLFRARLLLRFVRAPVRRDLAQTDDVVELGVGSEEDLGGCEVKGVGLDLRVFKPRRKVADL